MRFSVGIETKRDDPEPHTRRDLFGAVHAQPAAEVHRGPDAKDLYVRCEDGTVARLKLDADETRALVRELQR